MLKEIPQSSEASLRKSSVRQGKGSLIGELRHETTVSKVFSNHQDQFEGSNPDKAAIVRKKGTEDEDGIVDLNPEPTTRAL